MMMKMRNVTVRLASLALLGVITATSIPLGSLVPRAVAAESVVPQIVEMHLPTGQNLYIKEDHSRPIVTIDTWVKTGSVNETSTNNGVSHFLEHLLFKGTERHGPGTIDRILESRGAEFNAATSDDFTHFYITTAPDYFEEALALHGDMMTHAVIPVSELPQERKVVQEEINRANDNPSRQLYIALNKRMYGTHGYGFDTLGPKENIANIPREDILSYYHYWYQPRNFNTIIVGDISPEKAKALVEKTFPAPNFKPSDKYQAPTVEAVKPTQAPQALVLQNPNVSQAYLALAMPGPAQQNPDDVYALDLAMLALGSGKSSRLYRDLRENHPLVNSVSAGNYTQKYSGMVIIDVEAKPENLPTVKKEILSHLEELRNKGITADELAKAKTQYIKDFVFENETTDGTASAIGYNVTIGNLQDYRDHVSRVEKVTPEQIQATLKKYLDPNRAVMAEMLPSRLNADLKKEEAANLALLQASSQRLAKKDFYSDKLAQTPTGSNETVSSAKTVREAKNPITRTVLPNGLTLISKPIKDSSTLALKIFVKGGIGVQAKPGLASLVASVLMQGSQGRDAEATSRELESNGMSLSVAADDDYIEITGSAIAEDWGELSAVLQDVLTHPRFADKEIEKKKDQMRQAIGASRDNPSSVAFENLNLSLYPNHPYGDVGKRVEAGLDSITRQDLVDYYQRYFKPQNMVVALVGKVNPQATQNFLNALYPPCQGTCEPALTKVSPVPALKAPKTVVEEKAKLSAVWMAQGWLVPSIQEHWDYAALKVLNSLVGSGMSSRLFIDLREKQGLAYVVGSQYPSREQQSRYVMYIGTDPVNTDKVQAGFRHEIDRLKRQRVSTQELTEAKSKLIGAFALAHDTNISQAFYLGLYEALGAGYTFDDTYPDDIRAVTASDIQRVARRYLSGPSILSLVKPSPVDNASAAEQPKTDAKAETKTSAKAPVQKTHHKRNR
jgi:zinc protease